MDALDVATPRLAGWRAWWSERVAGLRAQGSRQWYMGAAFGLLYQLIMIISIWTAPVALWQQVLASSLLVPFYAGFLFLPPMFWAAAAGVRLGVLCVYWAYALVFFPLLGSVAFWLWILVAAVAATLCEEFHIVLPVVAVLVGAPLVYGVVTDFSDSAALSSAIIFSVAAMMFGLNRQIRAMRELKAAQSEVARLAVVEERARFSRDMHDVLGHSLTVVTVKSELAKKLIRRDADRAEEEVADIERLSRAALVDLRAAVAGYREISLANEVAAAQAALSAANIEAHLPSDVDAVAPEARDLFGWVIRESVTNVIRHSAAQNCWVELSNDSLSIADDGRGPAENASSLTTDALAGSGARPVGNGLLGLAERAAAAGARITTGVSSHGGFFVSVSRDAA